MTALAALSSGTVRLGVVGCGDVLGRSYVPGLEGASGAQIAAFCDDRADRAERAVDACSTWSPGAVAYGDVESLLAHPGLDAVINLTPPPEHGRVTHAALEAGLHVYSEKPLASSAREAQRLIAHAERRGLLLLCAPAIMAAPRFRWLQSILRSGRIGRPTLVCGQFANLGPAALDGYTGDPKVHYGRRVGPLVDQGVYVLHAITGLLGPVRRVQAVGATAMPCREITAGPRRGERVEVECHDHMLLALELEGGALGQLLSSFAVPASLAPALEIHATNGSISLDGIQDASGPVSVYMRDTDGTGLAGWVRDVQPPGGGGTRDLVAVGPAHFVAALRAQEHVRLGARHACHVLAVIEAARDSTRLERPVDVAADLAPAV